MKAPEIVAKRMKAVVKWTAASANGSAVLKYLVDISRGKDKTLTGSARKAVFRRLEPGRYKFRIAAVNEIGRSAYSDWTRIRLR